MELEVIAPVKNHLCNNCISNLKCALQSALVLECEEHVSEPAIQPSESESFTKSLPSAATPSHQGICSTCSLAGTCVWQQEGTIRIQCEHYQ